MNTFRSAVNIRYSKLADDENCCLSCGGAINYSKAQKGEICVDLGSGRGTDVLRLAQEVGKNGMVYGIDISDGMISKANKNAEKLNITNVKFIKSELAKIDLASNTADLIISNCTINHAKDKLSVWKEIFRILKDGGRFVVSDIYSIEEVPEKYRNDPIAISECWAGSDTREEYIQTLIEADFVNIKVLEESKPYTKGEIQVSSFTIAGSKKRAVVVN